MAKEIIILDTDIENEVDDQFALVYLLKSLDNFSLEAITIAPFSKSGYSSALTIEEGTIRSYETTLKIMDLLGFPNKEIVHKGAIKYFNDAQESNEAIDKIIEVARRNAKTTILAIGALTNVALAIYKEPKIIDKIRVIWLGGNSFLSDNNNEFNFRQDIKAVQTVFKSGVDLTVIPCRNVAANLTTTIYELRHYLEDKGAIGKYLCERFEQCKKAFINDKDDEIGMSKTLWDLSVIAYAINKEWFQENRISCPKVLDDGRYEQTDSDHKLVFVRDLFRNKIYKDFFMKMGCRGSETK